MTKRRCFANARLTGDCGHIDHLRSLFGQVIIPPKRRHKKTQMETFDRPTYRWRTSCKPHAAETPPNGATFVKAAQSIRSGAITLTIGNHAPDRFNPMTPHHLSPPPVASEP